MFNSTEFSFRKIIIFFLLQGITEFLPISSSGHLILLSLITELKDYSLSWKIFAHAGTLIAVVFYFRSDLLNMTKGFLLLNLKDKLRNHDSNRNFVFKLVLATIPSILLGTCLGSKNIDHFYKLSIIGWNSIIYGVLLYIADIFSLQTRSLKDITYLEAFVTGIFQSMSLVPGTSRSGICITVTRFFRIRREDSVKFSFLLSIPTTIAAVSYSLLRIYPEKNINSHDLDSLLIGGFLSCLVGILTIHAITRWLSKFGFKLFAIYRLCFGFTLILISNQLIS